MPVYNSEKTVARAVNSVLDQTWQNLELIIIDDGSDDATSRRISEFSDKRIRYYRVQHGGIVSALNTGLRMASCNYIARMDADDRSYPLRIAHQADYLDKNPGIGLVSSRVRYVGDARKFRGYKMHVDWLNTLLKPDEIYDQRFVESPFAHPSVMFRKNIVYQCGG